MKSPLTIATNLFKCLAALTIICGAENAAAKTITYSIAFYNEASVKIGNGIFSYDDATSDFIETNAYIPSEGIYVDNALTTFSATIGGYAWSGSYNKWLADAGTETGEVLSSQYGPETYYDSWSFGDSPWEDALSLYSFLYNSGNQIWSGSWDGYYFPDSLGSDPVEFSGSWVATIANSDYQPIPIPAALPLFASSLFLVGFVTKRRTRA